MEIVYMLIFFYVAEQFIFPAITWGIKKLISYYRNEAIERKKLGDDIVWFN